MRDVEEWFEQSDYDMATAESMFATGRYLYAVFHGVFDIGESSERRREEMVKSLIRLNEAQIAARYPEKLRSMISLLSLIRDARHR